MALSDDLYAGYILGEASGTRADVLANLDLDDNKGVSTDDGGALFIASGSTFLSNAHYSIAGEFTVSFWINPVTLPSDYQGIFSIRPGPYIELYINPSKKLAFYITDGASVGQSVDNGSGTNVTTAVYQHIVMRFTAANGMDVWLNNSLEKGPGGGQGSLATISGDFQMGSDALFGSDGGRFYDGIMKNYYIWSRAITDQEIEDLYNGGEDFAYPFISTPTFNSQLMMHHLQIGGGLM